MIKFKREFRCKGCGGLLDVLYSVSLEAANNGLVQAMLMADAVDDHRRHGGCPCPGWTVGAIEELDDEKGATS